MNGKTVLLTCGVALALLTTVNAGNSDPSQAPDICAALGSEGVLVAHEDCNKFNKCSGGKPVALDCPEGLLWNSNKEYCDWPENVKCRDNSQPENPSEADRICAEPGSNGVLVPHEDCDKFYKCAWGLPVAIDCPDGLLYNPDKQYCDWPSQVDCNVRNPNPPNNNNAHKICAAFGSNDKLVPHERCDKFYQCSGGWPVEMNCPAGLHFNPNKDYCDWPKNVNCGGGNPGPSNPSEAEKFCAQPGSNDKLVAHERCNRFYICSFGRPIAMNCPAGLFFNPAKDYCDWPNKVQCSN